MENTTDNCFTSVLTGVAEAMLEDDVTVFWHVKRNPKRFKKVEIVTGLELTKSHHFGAPGGRRGAVGCLGWRSARVQVTPDHVGSQNAKEQRRRSSLCPVVGSCSCHADRCAGVSFPLPPPSPQGLR